MHVGDGAEAQGCWIPVGMSTARSVVLGQGDGLAIPLHAQLTAGTQAQGGESGAGAS